MAGTITVKPNQSMADVVIMAVGSMEGAAQFCRDNKVSLSQIPTVGTVYQVTEKAIAAAGPKGAANLRYFAQNKVEIGNLNLPPVTPPVLGFRVVLYMPFKVFSTSGIVPSTLGYWDITAVASSAPYAINLYPVAAAVYSSHANPLDYLRLEDVLAFHPYSTLLACQGSPVMSNMRTSGINWRIPYTSSPENSPMLVMSSYISSGLKNTIELQDSHGNKAMTAPFVILKGNQQYVYDCLLPNIKAELVGSSATHATLRFTKGYPVPSKPEWGNYNLDWMDVYTLTGTADPLDPTNTNKRLVEFTPGTYKIRVKADHYSSDGLHTPIGGSAIDMVIEIL